MARRLDFKSSASSPGLARATPQRSLPPPQNIARNTRTASGDRSSRPIASSPDIMRENLSAGMDCSNADTNPLTPPQLWRNTASPPPGSVVNVKELVSALEHSTFSWFASVGGCGPFAESKSTESLSRRQAILRCAAAVCRRRSRASRPGLAGNCPCRSTVRPLS